MSTTTTIASTSAIASGTTPIPFTFQAISPEEVGVERAGAPLDNGTDFTVALNGDGTGTVTPTSSWGTDTVYIFSDPNFEQPADFTRFGPLYPDQIVPPLDRLARGLIALKGLVGRTITVPFGIAVPTWDEFKALMKGDQGEIGPRGIQGPPGEINGIIFITPEQFGAGLTANDTSAFQDLATAVNAAGGAVIDFKQGATYTVGRQDFANDGTWMFKPQTICNIHGCTKPVIVRGNGAKMTFADDLKYGTFDTSGVRVDHAQPYSGPDVCGPTGGLEGMLTIHDCTGPIHVENIDFDGNYPNLDLGGPWGDQGYQAPGDCLMLFNNTGGESTLNVRTHHAPRDGLDTWRSTADDNPGSLHIGFQSYNNGRQACSISGGRKFTFINPKLNSTGKSIPSTSAPGAGLDLESGFAPIRDVRFIQGEFADNSGPGMVSDIGDTENVLFDQCRFIGTTNYAAWINQKRFKFRKCLFIGQIIGGPESAIVTDAAQFEDCEFTDDPTASIYGAAYVGAGGMVAFNGGSGIGLNIRFDRCKFTVTDVATGASLAVAKAILTDCEFDQVAGTIAALYDCHLRGRIIINAPSQITANMPGSIFSGEITLNGTMLMRVSETYDPPSLAAGAQAVHDVIMLGAALGDRVEATFSLDLQGITLTAQMNAANHATVILHNGTAGVVDLASGTLAARAIPMSTI